MTTTRRRSKRSKRSNKWMKIIRRVHLYLGLILLPWVLFFGVSGFLFNHNSTFFSGSEKTLQAFNSDEVDAITPYTETNLTAATTEILAQMNTNPDSPDYQVEDTQAVSLNGHLKFTGPTDHGLATVSIDPVNGSATVSIQNKPSNAQSRSDFEGKKVSIYTLDTDRIATQAALLLQSIGIEPEQALELKSRGAPELRFQIIDADGRSWNTSYNVATKKLSARASDEASDLNVYNALTRLHKQHGYSDQVNIRWFWTLFTDITALTLIFWGLSGAIMWWQMKPTRLIGIGGLSVAVVLAAVIFGGTFSHISYNRARENPATRTKAREAEGPSRDRKAGKTTNEREESKPAKADRTTH